MENKIRLNGFVEYTKMHDIIHISINGRTQNIKRNDLIKCLDKATSIFNNDSIKTTKGFVVDF